jgi:thiol-disulfide isomerase/thioredoxin
MSDLLAFTLAFSTSSITNYRLQVLFRDSITIAEMTKPLHIASSSQFSSILSSNTVVIADFYADWCGPCKAIAPLFEKLTAQHSKPGKVIFIKIDVDAQKEIAKEQGVTA